MKVAHIVGSLESRYGGPSRSVRAIAGAMAEQGHAVDLLTSAPTAMPVETGNGLSIHTWRRPWPGALGRVPEMAGYLRSADYRAVHYHGLWLRSLHYARGKAMRDRIPLVVSPRGMMSSWAWQTHRTRKAFAAAWIHPGAFAAASGWHATSAEEAGEIRQLGFAQPICVAPNGVESPTDDEVANARTHWQAVLAGNEARRVALFYSRFHPKKRVVELIDLWASLTPGDWTLLIVGVPETYSVAQLRAYVHRSGAKGPIEVHDGTDLPPPYAIASLFLLPSHNENFGLVIAEAAANGVPAVVTDTTPWAALQREGMGWCTPWGEYRAGLRAALAESAAALEQRGAAVRRWVLREFSWQKSARDLVAFYETLGAKAA